MQKLFLKIRKRLLLVTLLFLIASGASFAQGEYDNWMFGQFVNVNVNGAIVQNANSSILSIEACASISDANGVTLFYTDGRSVWNENHVFFTSGNNTLNGSPNSIILNGSISATQGVVIIPRPGSVDEYFIYTVSDRGTINNGLTQYTVNANTETVLSTVETNPLHNYATTEQITAVPHCNGVDYWVIVKPISNNGTMFGALGNPGPNLVDGTEILAYLVTAAGISDVPVESVDPNWDISGAGASTALATSSADVAGTTKFSPNREYFAVAERQASNQGFIHLYRFDCSTGMFDPIQTRNQPALTYGLSFSPDSRFLYTQLGTNINIYSLLKLYNDTCTDDTFSIIHSFNSLNGSTIPTQLQMAPNGNIYVTKGGGTNNLGEIINPNDPLGTMVYDATVFPTGLANTALCYSGLPNNMDGLYDLPLEYTTCINCDEVCFELIGCNDSIVWDFGDGDSLISVFTGSMIVNYHITDTLIIDTSWGYTNPCHVYDEPGVYYPTVSALVDTNWTTFTDSVIIGGGVYIDGPATSCGSPCYTLTPLDTNYSITIVSVTVNPGSVALPTVSPTDSNTYCLDVLDYYADFTIEFVFEDSLGCQFTITDSVKHCCDSIQINFSSLPDVCVTHGGFPLGFSTGGFASPPGGDYSCPTCPPGSIVTVGGGTVDLFYPSVAGVGTWPIQYIYTDTLGCSDTAVQNILIHDGLWNITTSNSNLDDEGKDIITDSQGNIYVTGIFQRQTTFPASTPVTIPPTPLASSAGSCYIAKFNSCGELVWINYDSENLDGRTKAGSITLDETTGAVYMGGAGVGNVVFQSVAATPFGPAVPAASFNLPGSASMFIAKFDMNAGAYQNVYISTIATSVTTLEVTGLDSRHLPTGETDLYYCATFVNSPTTFARINKVRNLGATYNDAVWPLVGGTNYRQSAATGSVNAMDIAYNRQEERVYVTGRFATSVNFVSGGPSATTVGTTDAYFAAFRDMNGASQLIRAAGVTSTQTAMGTGVDVDANGATYLTGFFSGNTTNMFGYGSGFSGGMSGIHKGYVFKINYTTLSWQRQISALPSNLRPSGICVDASNLYITGTFGENIISPPAGPAGAYSSFSGLPKFFIIACGQAAPGSFLWANTGTDALAGSEHFASRVAVSNTFTYATGAYKGQFDYNITTGSGPASGALVSSPVTNKNTFIVRNEILASGGFRNAPVEEGSSESVVDDMFTMDDHYGSSGDVNVYPNPTTGIVNIQFPDDWSLENTTIDIRDVNGKTISISTSGNGRVYQADISPFTNGVYVIRLSDGVHTQYHKLIKQ